MLARSIHLNGIVQGVGFRPFVYRLAKRHGLVGWVLNSSEGVFIEVEGKEEAVENFTEALQKEAPPLSRIEAFRAENILLRGHEDFAIRESSIASGWTLASPDIVTCPDCRKEIFDRGDRRSRYPFTNCTNCGPRYSIIQELPYDRPKTTMKGFHLCPECEGEYRDPGDRRFHAQPVCCPCCGPRLRFDGAEKNALDKANRVLGEGKILALKGLGGYQLALDARNEAAVKSLRLRKKRDFKPFAVMVKDLEAAKKIVHLLPEEEKLLSSSAGPIVLARKNSGSNDLASSLAPNLVRLGVMLPSTPLHHLLFAEQEDRVLIMTSGNHSGEPLATEDADARERLASIADHFLSHDRAVQTPIDDSVVRLVDASPVLIRRARGYAPAPIELPVATEEGILATGGDLKCALALTKGGKAILSQHIGDLADPLTLQAFEKILENLKSLFKVEPNVIAADLHPDYFSTRWAQNRGLPLILLQHHEAHIASCLAENGIGPTEKVIGVAFDGTGYGRDGTIWGGEFFVGSACELSRRYFFEPLPLPGGEVAIKHPCRIALAYLEQLGLEPTGTQAFEVLGDQASLLSQMVRKNINCASTSSVGRLFDAASSLLGVCQHVSYEGQAAMELEAIALPHSSAYPWHLEGQKIKMAELFSGMLDDLKKRMPVNAIAGRFHRTLAEIVRGICRVVREEEGLDRVALSGGVFQNALLLSETLSLLEKDGFSPLIQRLVPANDGGIALGQCYLAALTR